MKCILLSLIISQIPSENITNDFRAVLSDISSLPPELRGQARYATCYNIVNHLKNVQKVKLDNYEYPQRNSNGQIILYDDTIPQRDIINGLITFSLNSLSFNSAIHKVYVLPNTNDRIVRFFLYNYNIDEKDWNKFVFFEPYTKQLVIQRGDGSLYRPLIRSDWLLTHIFEEPHYSRLLFSTKKRPTNRKEFLSFFGVNEATNLRLNILKANVVNGQYSIVANNDRRLVRYQSILGPVYETFDFVDNIDKLSKDKKTYLARDVVENITTGLDNKQNVKLDNDAGEIIARLPNDLQAYGLVDKQGGFLKKADPLIATDKINIQYDPHVYNGKSCVWCHENGLRIPGNDNFASIEVDKFANLKLLDFNTQNLISNLYRDNFEFIVRKDRQNYIDAIARCNGLKSNDNAKFFHDVVSWYDYTPVNLNEAAIELGISKNTFRKRIIEVSLVKRRKEIPGIKKLLDLVNPQNSIDIQRENWENVYSIVEAIIFSDDARIEFLLSNHNYN